MEEVLKPHALSVRLRCPLLWLWSCSRSKRFLPFFRRAWLFTFRVTNGSSFRWRASPSSEANRSVTDRGWERGTDCPEAQKSTSCNGKEKIFERWCCLQKEKKPGAYGGSPLRWDWCTGGHESGETPVTAACRSEKTAEQWQVRQARNLERMAAHRSQETPVQADTSHETRRVWRIVDQSILERDISSWAPVQRHHCAWTPEGKRPRTGGKSPSHWAC